MTSEPEMLQRRGINPVWIIPFLALAMGAYLVVQAWLSEGPEITVTFETATGLVAGKTKVRYRNVDMGLVTDVSLSDDLLHVEATIAMDFEAKQLLSPDTRFWLVTARVGEGSISGLDTLLSGAYVEMAPGSAKGASERRFDALDKPPATPAGAPGIRLTLLSDHAGSIGTGNAVLYKGYRVGRVEVAELDPQREQMRYVVFIDAPFHELVDSSVRFWDTSGISLSAGADGVRLRTGSLDTMLLGGIAFGRPEGADRGEPVASGDEFRLFDSLEATLEDPYRFGSYFVVQFSESLKGLLPGAPVNYRGLRIGHVERIMIKEMLATNREPADLLERADALEGGGRPISVLIYVEPGRIALPDTAASVTRLRASVARGIEEGLRAKLETGNLLTGAKYVSIDYFDVSAAPTVQAFEGYSVIPSIRGDFDQILVKVNAILDKIEGAPIDQTLASADGAMLELRRVLGDVGDTLESDGVADLPQRLDATLAELSGVLEGLAPDSDLYRNLSTTMRQLDRTMANVEQLTRTLSEQPSAALLGPRLPDDPQPEAP